MHPKMHLHARSKEKIDGKNPVENNSAYQNALSAEQEFLDCAYQNLDQQTAYYEEKLRSTRSIGASGTPGARSERDSFATHYEDNLARLKTLKPDSFSAGSILIPKIQFMSDG
ncbi:hypothetical protein RQN30_02650 [Arcanobacterium hippocoleae]